MDDGQGGTVTQPVTVTITGTNDAPTITVADTSGAVRETDPVTAPSSATTPVLGEVEANDTFATAQIIDRAALRIAPNANLGDATDPSISVTGAVSAPGAQDVFRLDLSAGELLTLDIDFAAGFGTGQFPGYPAGFGLDSFVFIYDANGTLLNFNDDAPRTLGGGGSRFAQDSYLQFVAPAGGSYFIVVRNWDGGGATSAGPYTLQVSVDSQNLQLTDTGAISFADVDLRDGHTVSVSAEGAGYLGGLTAVVSNASTNDGVGAVQWTFSVANAAVQFLAAGETRTQSYVVTVNDGQGGTASETVTVTITGENDRPTISTAFSSGQVVENAALAASGVIAFDDVDLIDAHSVSSAADGSGYLGTFSASISDPATGAGAGEVTWTFNASDAELQYLAAGQSLLQRYIVTVDDGNGGTTQQLVNITIVGTNDAPTITSAVSSGAVTEDGVTTAAGAIAFADVDLRDGHTVAATADNTGYLGTFTTSVTDNGAGDGAGSVSWNFAVDNAVTQHLAAGQTLTQSYTVTVSDGQGGTVSQPVTITITGANDAPVVQNVAAAATEDGAPVTAAFSADDLDSDDDAGSLTYVVTSTPSEGSVVNNGDGTFSFNPGDDFQNLAAGETRDITFGYNAIDSHGAATPGSVTIKIAGVNDAPVANADAVTTSEDTPVTFDVRANDTDIDSAARTVTHINGSAIAAGGSVTLGDGGLVGMNTDGTLTYTPAPNANGTRSFSYTISDGDGGSASSTVNLTVTPVNDAPVANPDSVTVNEDASVNFDVRANDTDIDGGSRTVTHINGSAISVGGTVTLSDGGRVLLNSNGTLTYTPVANANGARTFDYTISDGQGGSATSSVNVTVNPVNDRPVAVNDVASATEAGGVQNGTGGQAATGNVLANDTDIDDTLLVVSAERTGAEAGSGTAGTVGSPLNGAYGTLTLNANGSYSYVVNQTNAAVQALNTGGTLTDTFTYTTRDAAGLTDTAQLTVTINGANDAPVAQNVTLQANQLGNGGFDASPNFSGWTVNTATSGLVSASNGTATIDRGGAVIAGDAAVAVLQFSGNVPSGYGTAQGPSITSAAFAGQAGDTVRFVYKLSSGGDYAIGTGYIRDAVTGAIVQTIFNYQTPFTGSTGVVTQDVVLTGSGNYTIDFRVGSYDATGGRFVGARLDLGFAGILRNGVSEDESFTFAASNFTAGATDVDGGTLTVVSVGTSANGATVTLNANGTVLYNPIGHLDFLAAGQQLVDTFQYTLSDGRGGFSTATASVTVIGKDEAPAAMVIANSKGKGGEEVLPGSADKDDSGPAVLPDALDELDTEADRSTDLFTVSDDDGMLTIDPDGVLSFGSRDGDDDFLVLSGDVVDQPLVLPGLTDDIRSNLDLTPRPADNDGFLTIDQDGQLNFGTAVVGQDLFVLAGDLVDQPLVLPGEGIDEMFDFQPLSDLFAARHGAMHLTVTEDGQILGGEHWFDANGLYNWA